MTSEIWWQDFWFWLTAMMIIASIPTGLYGLFLFIKALARRDYKTKKRPVLFVEVGEREAVIVEKNSQFDRVLISGTNFRHRGNSEWTAEELEPQMIKEAQPTGAKTRTGRPQTKMVERPETPEEVKARLIREGREPHPWDIIKFKKGEEEEEKAKKPSWWERQVGGLHWLGLPGQSQIKLSHVVFTKRTQKKEAEKEPHEKGKMAYKYETADEEQDRVLVVIEDVYFATVQDAEDMNGVPLNVTLAITMSVFNAFKAAYNPVHLIDVILNQVAPDIREFIKGQEFETMEGKQKELSKKLVLDVDIIARVRREYGTEIRMIQVVNIDPDPEYRKLTTAKYEAQKKAEAKGIEADAEENFLKKTVGYIAADSGRQEAYKWRQLGQMQNLQAIGGQVMTAVGGKGGKT